MTACRLDSERAGSRSLGEEASMKANSNKSKQGNKAAHRVIAGVLCGASVLSLVLSLVMPPISQAIANDAQTVSTEETEMGGGSSSESTDVDDTTNGDTENQNSDDAEGDETGDGAAEMAPLSDDAETEGAAQPADDGVNGENTIALAAEGDYSDLSPSNIYNVLENDKKAGKYRLTQDITYDNMITLGQGETVIDLYGHKILHSGAGNNNSNLPMFNVPNGATLTILDSKQAEDKKSEQTAEQGKLASVSYSTDGKTPLNLTYYVTESSVDTKDSTRTNETTYKHEVAINGAIVGTKADSTMKLINVYEGGTFNLQSGVLTTTEDAKVGSLIYAENGSIVNMSGGYVCGATSMSQGAGIELGVNNGQGATLNLTGGVIAGNYAPDGGGVYANGSTINMTVGTTGGTTGGTISGNGTFEDRPGYGAGICAFGSSTVNISGGYITNNNCQFNYITQNKLGEHKGFGCHGGGGIAAYNGGSLQISGGYITSNYSAEAGGGVYAGFFHLPLDSFTFSGGTIASNVAQNSEGGGVRIAAPTVGTFDVKSGQKAYITNNETKTTNDWGGGGIFVQGGGNWNEGNSSTPVASARLYIYNTLIENNHAEGYGGGFAACPSGKTAITDTNGIAIFGNSDADGAHLSGGTNGKNEDQPSNVEGGQITGTFKQNGHKDLFLICKSGSTAYIAAVTGQMLGGGAAGWSGTIDNEKKSIGKYEGAQAKYMIGLAASPSEADKTAARTDAALYITGNSSNIHGGGIMTNGDVVAGSTTQVKVYPKMKLNGTKALTGRTLKEGEFEFQLLKQNKITNKNGEISYTVPSFDESGNLLPNRCSVVGTAKNAKDGSFSFNLSEVYADDDLVYYLVEVPGADKDVNYDKTIYKIDPKVEKDEIKSHKVLDIEYTYYTVSSVQITTIAANGATSDATVNPTTEGDVASVALTTNSTTFTNAYTKYDSMGSWTPKATKVVEGGEMKEFTLEFADNESFTGAKTVKTTAGGDKSQPLSFDEIDYKLSQLDKGTDPTGRGASKTFTYYVREKDESSIFSHYKFDQSVYKFTVVATDDTNRAIDCQVTYRKGTVDSDGKWKDAEPADHKLTDDSIPTFTNTYSTSLPLSGMSGVTLTYLAGAAVLCAAAAWMHIRRKANAKGGERRE